MKEKKYANKIFFSYLPTDLPNQTIQDRGAANKHFFKDGLMGNATDMVPYL